MLEGGASTAHQLCRQFLRTGGEPTLDEHGAHRALAIAIDVIKRRIAPPSL